MAVRVPSVMRRARWATRGRPRLPVRLSPRRTRIFAFLGLLDYLSREAWLLRWRNTPATGRLSGTFANPDHFGAWLTMLIFLGIGLLTIPTFMTGKAAQAAITGQEGVSDTLMATHEDAALLAFLFMTLTGALSWLGLTGPLSRSAVGLGAFTFLVHTAALVARMVIQGRPPVTNLYSSAVFIGWGCVGLGLFLEYIYRNGVGLIMGSALGGATCFSEREKCTDTRGGSWTSSVRTRPAVTGCGFAFA